MIFVYIIVFRKFTKKSHGECPRAPLSNTSRHDRHNSDYTGIVDSVRCRWRIFIVCLTILRTVRLWLMSFVRLVTNQRAVFCTTWNVLSNQTAEMVERVKTWNVKCFLFFWKKFSYASEYAFIFAIYLRYSLAICSFVFANGEHIFQGQFLFCCRLACYFPSSSSESVHSVPW